MCISIDSGHQQCFSTERGLGNFDLKYMFSQIMAIPLKIFPEIFVLYSDFLLLLEVSTKYFVS